MGGKYQLYKGWGQWGVNINCTRGVINGKDIVKHVGNHLQSAVKNKLLTEVGPQTYLPVTSKACVP